MAQNLVFDSCGDMVLGCVHSGGGKVSFKGVVVERFNRSAYVLVENRMFCIGLYSVGAGPITLLFNSSIKLLPPEFEKGRSFRLSDEYLQFENGVCFELSSSTVYYSDVMPLLASAQAEMFCASDWIDAIVRLECAPHDGLSLLLCGSTRQTGPQLSPLALYVQSDIDSLFTMLRSVKRVIDDHSRGQVSTAELLCDLFTEFRVRRLIGAGPGLTPSGDDFLCGVLHALYVRELGDVAMAVWKCNRDEFTERTNAVSATLIEHAAHGRIDESTGKLLVCLLGTNPAHLDQEQAQFSAQLNAIGHTSGWDWLTGFLLCLESLSKSDEVLLPRANAIPTNKEKQALACA